GALNTLQGGANPRGAAQTRMRALLNQDRALLSHRACGGASLVDEPDAPEIPLKGSQTRGAAQNRMRELLHQDRALLALRQHAGEPDDDFALELDHALDTLEAPTVASPAVATTHAVALPAVIDGGVARPRCVGVTTTFVAEATVPSVCTPGPKLAAEPVPVAVAIEAAKAVAIAEAPKPAFTAEAPKAVAPRPAVEATGESGADPIRTRGMAKLLALQGYKDRALSIYEELIAAEPGNAELRAEADRLRN
ncbi:MAG TPA: hypothetical protein VFN67_38390, partial [Polyangiales bacterium]|nr:hypothetical protein [Polyangiales bacterium]